MKAWIFSVFLYCDRSLTICCEPFSGCTSPTDIYQSLSNCSLHLLPSRRDGHEMFVTSKPSAMVATCGSCKSGTLHSSWPDQVNQRWYESRMGGSRQIGPRTVGPRTIGPWTVRGGRYGIFQKNEYFHWMNNQIIFWMNKFFEWIFLPYYWMNFWMNQKSAIFIKNE